MKRSIHEFQPLYSRTFDCDEWKQLLLETGMHQGITMELDGKKSTRFNSPSGSFFIIICEEQMELNVPKDKSRSANFYVGGISFRYIESKIEQLLMREILDS